MKVLIPITIILLIGIVFYFLNKNPKLPTDLTSAFPSKPNIEKSISIGFSAAVFAYSRSEYFSNGNWVEFRKSDDGLILIPKGIFGIGKPETSILIPWNQIEIADQSDSWGERPGEILRLKGKLYNFDFWALEDGYLDQIRSMQAQNQK